MGRLQPVPHGHDGRERREEVRHHAARSRTRWRWRSQQKAAAAQEAGRFKDEILPFSIAQKKGDPIVFAADEFVNRKTSAEALAGLRPAFDKAGTVTAGNASGLNDGAAAVLVMSAQRAAALGLKPLARDPRLRQRRARPDDHGHGPGAGVAPVPAEGRLEARRTST